MERCPPWPSVDPRVTNRRNNSHSTIYWNSQKNMFKLNNIRWSSFISWRICLHCKWTVRERERHMLNMENIFAFHKHKWNWWRFLSVKNTDSFRRSRMFAKFWTIDRIFEIILLFAFFDEFHWLNIGRPQAEVNGMNQCWRQYISSVIDSMWILKAPPMTATTEDLCLFRLPSFSAGRTAAAPLL